MRGTAVNAREKVQFRIAQEAARVMIEEGVEDYGRAKLKAAERLGMRDVRQLPRNDAIDLARQEYHRLYRDASHDCRVLALRQIALDVMNLLEAFSPCLVGDVVAGDAGPHSPVTIHVFPDAVEPVMTTLIDAGIPFRETSHLQAIDRERLAEMPGLSFFSGQSRVDIVVLASGGTGRRWDRRKSAAPRLSLAALRRLLAEPGGLVSPHSGRNTAAS